LKVVFASWLLRCADVFTAVRLECAGNFAAARPVAAVTGLTARFVNWRLYRLGSDPASLPPVPERTRWQARWLMWTRVTVGVSGSAWEIVRAHQHALGG
jgi:hypothetical protein